MTTNTRELLRARSGAAVGGLLLACMIGQSALAPCERCAPLTADAARLQLDPNVASEAELQALPEIGPALAAAIVSHRAESRRQPAFRTAADLDSVPRIGPRTIETLRPYLVFPPEPPPPVWTRAPEPAPRDAD